MENEIVKPNRRKRRRIADIIILVVLLAASAAGVVLVSKYSAEEERINTYRVPRVRTSVMDAVGAPHTINADFNITVNSKKIKGYDSSVVNRIFADTIAAMNYEDLQSGSDMEVMKEKLVLALSEYLPSEAIKAVYLTAFSGDFDLPFDSGANEVSENLKAIGRHSK